MEPLVDDHLKRLQVLIDVKRYEDALELGKDALKGNPGDGRVFHFMALALFKLNRLDEALEMAQAAANQHAMSPNLLLLMGEITFAQHDFKRAKEFALLALNLQAETVGAYLLLVKVCIQTGDFNKGEEYVDLALELDPNNYYALNFKSLFAKHRGESEEEKHYQKLAMEQNPNQDFGFRIMGTKAMMSGDWTEASKHFEEARRLNPNDQKVHKLIRRVNIFQKILLNPTFIGVFSVLLFLGAFVGGGLRSAATQGAENFWAWIVFNIFLGGRTTLSLFRQAMRDIFQGRLIYTSNSHLLLQLGRYLSTLALLFNLGWLFYYSFVNYTYLFILYGSISFFLIQLAYQSLYYAMNRLLSLRGLGLVAVYFFMIGIALRVPEAFHVNLFELFMGYALIFMQLFVTAFLYKRKSE